MLRTLPMFIIVGRSHKIKPLSCFINEDWNCCCQAKKLQYFENCLFLLLHKWDIICRHSSCVLSTLLHLRSENHWVFGYRFSPKQPCLALVRRTQCLFFPLSSPLQRWVRPPWRSLRTGRVRAWTWAMSRSALLPCSSLRTWPGVCSGRGTSRPPRCYRASMPTTTW